MNKLSTAMQAVLDYLRANPGKYIKVTTNTQGGKADIRFGGVPAWGAFPDLGLHTFHGLFRRGLIRLLNERPQTVRMVSPFVGTEETGEMVQFYGASDVQNRAVD